jgi:hypothetical protein
VGQLPGSVLFLIAMAVLFALVMWAGGSRIVAFLLTIIAVGLIIGQWPQVSEQVRLLSKQV